MSTADHIIDLPLRLRPLVLRRVLAGCSEKPAGTGARGRWRATLLIGSRTWRRRPVSISRMSTACPGKFYYPEIMAPGVALFDYDNDGDLDVYVTQGQMLSVPAAADAVQSIRCRKRCKQGPPVPQRSGRERRRDAHAPFHRRHRAKRDRPRVLRHGRRDRRLQQRRLRGHLPDRPERRRHAPQQQATAHSPTSRRRPARAIRAGGASRRRSSTTIATAGSISSSATTLYIVSRGDIPCQSVTGRRDYCPPNSYRAQPSRLFHNRGNGTFEEVTAKAFVNGAYGPALGASTADFNRDGWIDLYVANDGQPNQLWINQHNGTFKDTAFLAGAAVSGNGQAEASMGVDAGDFDNDGDEDLFITNWLDQMNVLYVNDGSGNFEDRRAASGLGPPSLAKTGFGAGWFDFDRDGWLDLFVANGGVATIEALARANDPFPLRMTPQLYRNLGTGRFEDVSSRAGAVFKIADVGRGVAFGDVDNDGDTDLLVGNANGRLRLLVNHEPNRNHWLGLRLVAGSGRGAALTRSTRRASFRSFAAQVRPCGAAQEPTAATRRRTIRACSSGLGASAEAPRVKVTWPSGRVEEFADVTIDRYITLKEGTGK